MKQLGLLMIGAVVMTGACDEPPPPEATESLTSRVELAAGNVWLVKEDGKERLITGAMLAEEATLAVDDGGRALVRLHTGASTFLRSGTTVSLKADGISLKKGELWAEVPAGEDEMGHFTAGDVTVSASDAGVDIAFDGEKVNVYVARGLAVVAAPGGRAEVQSGEQVEIAGKAAPKVVPVAFWEDWTGGMADRSTLGGMGGRASGRIYGIDRNRPGAMPRELQITSQSVRIGIKDGIAHTEVDQKFFNPGSTPLEGWYWFTVPEGASVERFALEVNGALVEGEMVERKQARAAYEEAVERAFDPALLEWVDGRTFRARIFPIPATGERRVVLSYFELLPMSDGVYRYTYPMASSGDTTIQEFSLNVHLGEEGGGYDIRTLQDATVEKDKSKISMRRSGFQPKADFLLELAPREESDREPLRIMRFAAGENKADYVMIRYSPEVAWESLEKIPGDVVVVLDTSAGGDDADRQIRADAVEAILRALSKGDRFAVMATDLAPRVVYPPKGLAEASEKNVSAAVEKLSEIASAGATDIGEMFSGALDLLHAAEQPAVVYVGDGRATVGETSTGALSSRLRRALGDSRARLFTIAVGADADVSLLERLARIGGGRSFTISRSEQTVQEALHFVGMLKTPTLTELHIDAGKGLDQVFTTQSGKLSKGDEMILLARTHHALPDEIKITGRLGDKAVNASYNPSVETGKALGYIPIIWARQYLARLMGDGLEENHGRIISLGLNYGLMTPFSSFLVLESDAAYMQQGIQRRNRYRFSSLFDRAPVHTRPLLATRVSPLTLPLELAGCSAVGSEEDKSAVAEEMVRSEAPPAPPSVAPEGQAALNDQGKLASMGDAISGEASAEKIAEAAPARTERPRAKKSSSRRGKHAPKPSAPSPDRMEQNPFDDDRPGQVAEKGGGSGYGRGERAKDEEGRISRKPAAKTQTVSLRKTPAIFKKGICSDASRRALAERRILWQRRMIGATDPATLHRLFFDAGERCELERWIDRKVMLDIIEQRVTNPDVVRGLLAQFDGHPRIQRYLRQRILKRALDPDMSLGLHIAGGPNWANFSAGLAAMKDPAERLTALREMVAKYPDDPKGRELLIAMLTELDKKSEAIREATKLKRDGLATPRVMELLCDLQAGAGRVDEARRTCSELVEFNAADPGTRQRLGDIFLRHGWYEAAYRQYESLVAMLDANPLALLRLAAAAAGMGKVDEALRIERKVASGDGEPGPTDPRRFARLHSAARLAQMLKKARDEKNDTLARAIERSLKQTQVFGAESTIVLLVWEDFQSPLRLMPQIGEEAYAVSDHAVSLDTGLVMMDIGRTAPEGLSLMVEPTSETLRRDVPYTLLTIKWDGKSFVIEEREASASPETPLAA